MTNPNTQINGRLEKKKNYDQRNGAKKNSDKLRGT